MVDLVQSNRGDTENSHESLHSASSIVQDNLSNDELSQYPIDFSTHCDEHTTSSVSYLINIFSDYLSELCISGQIKISHYYARLRNNSPQSQYQCFP